MFLDELEQIIDIITPQEFRKVHVELMGRLGKCIRSSHFQVAERTLYFWNNEYFVSLLGVGGTYNGEEDCLKSVLEVIMPALWEGSRKHWNQYVFRFECACVRTC